MGISVAALTILTDAVTEVQSGAEARSGCARDRRLLESSVDDGEDPVYGLSAIHRGCADRLRPPGDGMVLRATPEQRAQRSMPSPS